MSCVKPQGGMNAGSFNESGGPPSGSRWRIRRRYGRFARAVGQGAKTDPLDAQILAHYGAVFELPVAAAQEAASEEVRALLGRRQQLLDQRTQEQNRLEKGLQGRVKKSCQRHLAWLDQELKQLEEEYQQAIQAKPELAERAALYQSVRGVGLLTAATLLAYVPELGQGSGKALTALVGLVPWAADSGTHRGYRAIRGGRGLVRRALYMAALSVIRTDTDLGRWYQGLRRRGKPGKVALVAVMRKLLLRLHAMARRGTPGSPKGCPPPKKGLTSKTDTPDMSNRESSVVAFCICSRGISCRIPESGRVSGLMALEGEA